MALFTHLPSSAGATLRSSVRQLPGRKQTRGKQIQQIRQHTNGPKHTVDASQPQPAQAPAPAKAQLHPAPPTPPKSTSFLPIPIPGQRLFTTALQPITAPFRAYGRAQHRHPLRTQIMMSIVIYFIGDVSSQFVLQDSPSTPDKLSDATAAEHKGAIQTFFTETYSPGRSLRAVIIGGLFSIPSYRWFLYLGRNFNVGAPVPRQARFIVSLTYKVIINQLLFTPLFNSYFFGMHSLLAYPLSTPLAAVEGADKPGEAAAVASEYAVRFFSVENAYAAAVRVRDTVPISWWNSCKVWPAVTAFSFTFVAPQHRNLFAGCVAVVWQTYLGMVNQRAVAAERERARLAVAI